MKTNRFFTICIVLLTMACKKDTLIENFTPKANNNPVVPQDTVSYYQSLQDFFNQNSAPLQSFTINPAIYNVITGSKGGKIIIGSNAFKDSLGNFPSGNVVVSIAEIYSVKDMILSNKPTVSGGNILVSGGELFFNATTASGNSLSVAEGKYLIFNIPIDSSYQWQMGLFVGTDNDSTGGVNWYQQDSIIGPDTTGTYYQFYLYNLNFNWINCDYFWNNPNPKTNITLNFTSAPQETLGINAYLVFKEINSVIGLYPYLSAVQAYNIPEGTTPVAVAIGVSVTSNKLYFAKTTLTVTTNLTTTLTLTPATTKELKAALDEL